MTDNGNEELVVEPQAKGISDVFSDGVLSAISELDADLISAYSKLSLVFQIRIG